MVAVFKYQFTTDLGNTSVRLGSIQGLTESADQGTVATSSIDIDDPTGTRTIEPFRAFTMLETSCSRPMTYYGYISDRVWKRAPGLQTSAARRITVSVEDQNAVFSMKLITHSTTHYKRPAETDIARIAWMLGSGIGTDPLGLLHDNGLVDTANPVNLTATDYTGQFSLDVMNDCAGLSGKNFFAYWDEAAQQQSLAYFTSTDAAFYPSTLSISNVLSDRSSTCFSPIDAEGAADPSQVYSGVLVNYSGGSVYVIASRTLARDAVAPEANTSSRDKARALGQKFLAASADEMVTVSTTIQVPASQVNLIKAGMLVTARFTYVPGWDPGIPVRVLQCSVKQDEQNTSFYNVAVTLGHPLLVNFKVGSDADNTRVWPSDQPPFVPSNGEPFVYVQSAKTANNSDTHPTATYAAPPTEGNLLIATLLAQQVGSGSPDPSEFTATFPSGWLAAIGPVGTSTDGRLNAMWMAYKFAEASEPSTVAPTIVLSGVTQNGFIDLAEYSGPSTVDIAATDSGAVSGPSATATLPSITPTTSAPALIVPLVVNQPGYSTSYSAGWNVRQQSLHAGPRQNLAYVDQIVAAASGAYTGTATGNLGDASEWWFIPAVAFSSTGGTGPAVGQPVAPESATADGSQVIYQTSYPYVPGSLIVKVNGLITAVDETDPTTGTFTLPAPPASGAIITWTYNVADLTPTGANNPAPDPAGTSVPPAPGTMPGGDGINRQPQLSFVPAETPNGVITVFTIPPYVAGTTLVYINGLIQRITTDYAETSPGTGVITFVTAPWTGATIIIAAMPYLAAPPPTGGRSVTWAAPVTTATYTIPGSIDPTGAADVVATMNAWVASVPDGSILDFAGGTFKMSQGIQLSNRHNLELDGNGATIVTPAGSSGADQLSSAIIVGHLYGGSWSLGSTDIQIHDFTLTGNDATPGTFTPGVESEANLEMTGCTRLEVYNITGSAAPGDFIFVEDITDGWFHNNTGTTAGRNGVSVISGNRVLVEDGAFATCGYNTFDVEPNNSSQACTAITIRDSTAATWGNAFFGVEGSHTGAPIHGVTVSGITITGKSLLSIVDNGNTSRMTNISIINNTSTAAAVAGPVLTVKYTDNVTLSGNTQPLSSGSLVSTTSCTNVVT